MSGARHPRIWRDSFTRVITLPGPDLTQCFQRDVATDPTASFRFLSGWGDGEQVPAQLIAASSLIDFAMLKVNVGHPLPILHFADSDRVQLGQRVIAIGNPLGLGTSVSAGVLSRVGRNLMKTPIDEFIQTDASINPGNSGGPLLECDRQGGGGRHCLALQQQRVGIDRIGFALPSNDVAITTLKLMNPMIAHPNWVGLELQDLSPALAESFGDQATHVAMDGCSNKPPTPG